MLGSPVGIAAGTTIIETPMKLVDGTGQGIVPVYEIGIDDGPDGLFVTVLFYRYLYFVLNQIKLQSYKVGPLLGNLVFLVVEPLQALE